LNHYLPAKINSYLIRLQSEYAANGNQLEQDLLSHCRAHVVEETEYDNLNGGTYGHDVWLYLPLDILTRIGINKQEELAKRICEDLRTLSRHVPNEFFNLVHLELNDEDDPAYQAAKAISSKPTTNPDSQHFWKPGMLRLFISHKDKHKVKANALAQALQPFGISSFVAHDTIEPMSEWRKEIMKGLETMEAMLVFLTDDFEDSTFTNQEVGFALGANKPVLSLKLGRKDPPGFINHEQALRGNIDDADASAQSLYPLLASAVGKKTRLDDSLVAAFISSTDFNETKARFDRMAGLVTKLSDKQLAAIVDGFYRNDQLYHAGHLVSKFERLRRYLEGATSKEFTIDGRMIKEVKPPSPKDMDDDIPF
jgi:TIR domain